MRKHLLPLSLLLAVLTVTAGWITSPVRFTLQPESRLWIEGTSSLHDWTCDVTELAVSLETASTVEEVRSAEVTVPVQQIECKNGTMNRKTRDALKAAQHPFITYELASTRLTRGLQDASFELEATGRLALAGTSKEITMTVKGEQLGDSRVRFTGSVPLRMTDFGIDPSTALLGTLKTGDQVVVHFDVVAAR